MDKANGMMTAHTAKMIKEKRMEKDKTTPRPWIVTENHNGSPLIIGGNQRGIAPIISLHGLDERQANAELIVKAVNRDHLFEPMLMILEELLNDPLIDVQEVYGFPEPKMRLIKGLFEKAKAAK